MRSVGKNFSPPDHLRLGQVRTPPDRPYEDDLDYIGDELDWVSLRIEQQTWEGTVERESTLVTSYREDGGHNNETMSGDRMGLSVSRLELSLERVQRQREYVDARHLATRQAGRSLELDRLCAEHELRLVERRIILRTLRTHVPLWPKNADGRCQRLRRRTALYVGHALNFLGLDFPERIRCGTALFGHESRLRDAGVIRLVRRGEQKSPDDFFFLEIELTDAALARLMGEGFDVGALGDLAETRMVDANGMPV